jgi:hypothetical protein
MRNLKRRTASVNRMLMGRRWRAFLVETGEDEAAKPRLVVSFQEVVHSVEL